jgi:D-psicose/D-tagatose/L-ribulose 3-epimerase
MLEGETNLKLMARKFAASAWIWSENPLSEGTELFRKVSEMGFDGIEIPTFDGNLDARRIRDLLSSSGLNPIIVGGGSKDTNLASESNLVREQALSYIERLVDISSDVGGDLVIGPLYTAVGEKRLLSAKERKKVLILVAEKFLTIARYVHERSVKLAIEPLCRYDTSLINTTSQGIELIDMNIEEKSLGDAIRLAGNHLFHFHACENDRGIPGSGHVNWKEVRKALDDVNYRNWISIESFVPNRGQFSSVMNIWRNLETNQDIIASDGLNYLRKILA